ncbi:MAG: hypothetical protein WC716_11535 [Chitinophagaceae bacterium]|jgi:hypothetical protein
MVNLKIVDDELIVSEIGNDMRIRYYLFAITFILIGALVIYLGYDYDSIFYVGFVGIFSVYGRVLKRPANWRPVKIKVSSELVFINRKKLRKEDLIFLSFHQTDECRTIRLEAKRSNIFRPNEARILSNCSSEEEAIDICRIIRDYIDPDLKICYVRLVKGKSKRADFVSDFGDLSNDITFEKRYFIE